MDQAKSARIARDSEEPGKEVDKTELNAALAEADAKVEADYTAESWEAFQAALVEAKEMPEETQEEVDAKLEKVNEAIALLIEKEDPVVEDDKIVVGSTTIDGVTLNYENGLLTIEIDETIDWDDITQDPNLGLGADADVLYVGIYVNRPNDDITHVLINDGTEDIIVELGAHEATTATGRHYYFGVAKKDEDGQWNAIIDEEAITRTVKWYVLEGEGEEVVEVLKATEKFDVIRVAK